MWFFLFFIALPMYAQLTGGALSGSVYDPSGAVIPGTRVELTDPLRGFTRVTATDAAGGYRFTQVPVGVYRVTAGKAPFRDAVRDSVTITVDSVRHLDFSLMLNSDTVTIEVPAVHLQLEAADSGTVIQRDRIERLPLNRRGFLQLALLTPGALPPVQDSELSSRGTFATHVNGGREEFNNFLLDGVDNNDLYTNRYVLEPSVDTIEEFKITAGSYSAEYGRSGGAQVNVITRSGSNEWHGLAYEYLRNRSLDAANYFDADTNNKYIRNQFGGTLSGPVVHDRTFFFANIDALRERRGLTRLATVPTLAERSGDLSARTTPVLDPFTRQPFPGNRIPDARINRVARRVLELFPLPNRPGAAGNYLAQPVLRDNFGQGGGRVDHHLRSNGILAFRYLYNRQRLFEPFAEDLTDIPGFGNLVGNTGHNAMLHHQQPVGAGFLHSFRVGVNRSTRTAFPENYQKNAAQLWNVPWLSAIDPRDYGFPVFNVQGYSPVGDATPLPLLRYTTTYQLQEDIAWLRGRHAWKAGFQARNTRANANVDLLARGSLSLSGAVSGSGISDLLLGFPTFTLQAKLDNTQTLRTTSYNAYLQDEWKLTARLNVTLGLRYEYNTPATDPYDRMAVYQPSTGRIIRVGTEGVSRSGIRADRNNFAPRAGFAWNARPNTVIRGGYGFYYDSGMLVLASSQYFNPPFFTLRAFFPTQTSLITLDNPFPNTGGISPVSPSTLSPDLTTAYVQHWSLHVQHQFGPATVVSVGYVGSAGTHLIRSRDPNQARPAPGDLASRRPFPQYGSMVFIEGAGNSNYHSLQASADRRFSRRLSLLAAYTWSKSIDDTSAFLSTKVDKNFPQDSRNFRAERAVSSYDIPHRFSASVVVALPGKFEFRGITVLQAGQAFTPLLRFDNSNTGNTGGNFGSDRPNVAGDPHLDTRTPDRWFNTAALVVPPRFTFGNAGRNILRGPAYLNFDAAIARRFQLTERLNATAEAQAFNLTNRTNFDMPEHYADEPSTFGRIFSAKPARQVQFALRLVF
ncbi:MAG TPA: TonB-dependent receptor [Bryobacteraceae bacterium]|nr:TonB-dependent receptor [Bryobacteraceae bacterium]